MLETAPPSREQESERRRPRVGKRRQLHPKIEEGPKILADGEQREAEYRNFRVLGL